MEPIKMAVLATGRIAGVMAKTIKEMDCVVRYGAASRSLEKAEQFAKEYGFEKAYGSYEEMVKDPEVQLVYVASPHSHHYEHIRLCLEHGKHVLCEKAFTVNAEQAEEVFALAKEKNLLLTEAMWVRYMPMTRKLQEVIDSGIIGKVSTVTANLYYLIDQVERIQRPELAGGALLDVGVYTLTFASVVMGDEIERIEAAAVKTETGVDAQNSITILYKDGRMASLCSGIMSISDRKGMIYGSKGFIIVENINNFEEIRVYNTKRELVETHLCPPQISGYEYQVEACVEAIRNGQTECPQMPHAKSVEIMRQMDEVRRQIGVVYPCE